MTKIRYKIIAKLYYEELKLRVSFVLKKIKLNYKPLSKMKQENGLVFIVEDDERFAGQLEKELISSGFSNIMKFHNGVHCLEQMSHNPYLILIDQSLPDMKGSFLVEKIKTQSKTVHTILLTEEKTGKGIIDAMKFGSAIILKGEDDVIEMLHENLAQMKN